MKFTVFPLVKSLPLSYNQSDCYIVFINSPLDTFQRQLSPFLTLTFFLLYCILNSSSSHHLNLHNPFRLHFPDQNFALFPISPMDSASLSSFTILSFIRPFRFNLPTKVFINVSLVSHVPLSSTGSSS